MSQNTLDEFLIMNKSLSQNALDESLWGDPIVSLWGHLIDVFHLTSLYWSIKESKNSAMMWYYQFIAASFHAHHCPSSIIHQFPTTIKDMITWYITNAQSPSGPMGQLFCDCNW
jgi:hypothetical protein